MVLYRVLWEFNSLSPLLSSVLTNWHGEFYCLTGIYSDYHSQPTRCQQILWVSPHWLGLSGRPVSLEGESGFWQQPAGAIFLLDRFGGMIYNSYAIGKCYSFCGLLIIVHPGWSKAFLGFFCSRAHGCMALHPLFLQLIISYTFTSH